MYLVDAVTIAIVNDIPYAKKSLGQHWLTDTETLTAICDAAEVTSSDTVLEIGPGYGTLTGMLAARAKQVVAVELDEQLARDLPVRVPAANLQVAQGSILTFDLTTLPPDYKVVANIPYYLTSNLIRTLSESANQPYVAVVLVQKEVAERVAAKPGDMSLLSVTAQVYWEVSLGRTVPAKLFTPPPKVDSQVLILARRLAPLFPDLDTKRFFQVVKAGFSQRRKTLLNSVSAGLHVDRERTAEMLRKSGLEPSARPQELSLEAWHALYENT